MKKKQVVKQLSLNKKTITNLNDLEQGQVLGGVESELDSNCMVSICLYTCKTPATCTCPATLGAACM